MNLRERIRRWWKPAEYADDHPLSDEEREKLPDRRIAENLGATYDEMPGTGTGPGTIPHLDDEFRGP